MSESSVCNLASEQSVIITHAGIVQGQAHVTKVHQQQDFRSVDIEFPRGSMAGIQIGASVAINGTCLTVAHAPLMIKSCCWGIVHQEEGMLCAYPAWRFTARGHVPGDGGARGQAQL